MVTEHQFKLHDDDKPVGEVLTRREVLALLGMSGIAFLVGCTPEQFLGGEPESTVMPRAGAANTAIPASTAAPTAAAAADSLPSCVVRPALTEGPYFVDVGLDRSDIRAAADGSLKEGALLRILFNVSLVNDATCAPLEGAQIDVWHCDAEGVYSGVSDPGFDTSGESWLRGFQRTDQSGHAEFTTIYPGWYSGRATHIHFKIRTDPDADQGYEFTSQFFFDEALTDVVQAQAPYNGKGYRNTLNTNDGIFQGSNNMLTLDVTEDDLGYVATFDIGLDTSQSGSNQSGFDDDRVPPGGSGA